MKKLFYELFRDDNNINEKSIIGFISFLFLVMTIIIDIITGAIGADFPIHEFVFNGFLIMTLGSFGIASVDKFVNSGKEAKEDENDYDDISHPKRTRGSRRNKTTCSECGSELG